MLVEAGTVAAVDRLALVGVVRSALTGGDIERWCNISLIVDEDDPQATPDSPLFGLLAARGPASPLATVMGATVGRKATPPQLGLQHKAGQKAAIQLTDAGLDLPDGWQWLQDHPRRGLIIVLPGGDCSVELIDWLLPAMNLLNRAPVTGSLGYELFSVAS